MTARLMLRLEMNGKGWFRSRARGVRAGNTIRSKWARRARLLSPSRSSMRWMATPSARSFGNRSSCHNLPCSSRRGTSSRLMASSCSRGVRPSGGASSAPPLSCLLSPETRTMKNSSRLLPHMARNLARSRRGWLGSFASSRMRLWNRIQLISRLMKRSLVPAALGTPLPGMAPLSPFRPVITSLSPPSSIIYEDAVQLPLLKFFASNYHGSHRGRPPFYTP